MDRRRFIPNSEGLERREVMSASPATVAAAAATPTTTTTTTTSTLPETIQQRVQRVQNLPFFLAGFQANTYIPPAPMKQIQDNLLLLITRLKTTPTSALTNYNLQIRKIQSNTSLSQSDAQTLNFAFGKVLSASGGNPTVVANIQSGLTGLIQAATNQPNPVMLAINDYSLVLQTALGIGRPLSAPSVPTLQKSDQAGAVNVSKSATPTLLGTYQANSTIQLLDNAGNVLATALTNASGQYSMTANRPLPNATYKLRVQALDTGFVSLPSRVFNLTIKVPTSKSASAVPKGPMSS